VVETTDTPAFAGNRVGFKVLNEVAQLAEEHGVAFMDALIGPHTGRAMAPLVTVDFVGWDVHKAIVDNLYANTSDEAHAAFALPAYMQKLALASATRRPPRAASSASTRPAARARTRCGWCSIRRAATTGRWPR
jgi:3-hydroxyacyl-CoA dehydrogenase